MSEYPVNDLSPIGPQPLIYLFLSGRTATTLRAYRRDLEDFRTFTGEPTVVLAAERLLMSGAGPANSLALGYRSQLLARGLQAATVNRRLATLHSLVKLGRLTGLVNWELETPGVRQESYRDTRGPGKDAVRQMLEATAGDEPGQVRDRALVRLLFDLGLRRGEAAALDREDLDLPGKRVWIRGKGQRDKTALTLPPPTLQAVEAWLRVRGEQPGPLFTNFDRARKGDGRLSADHIYRVIRRLGEAVGVRARPHGLRHTAITEACKAAEQAGIGLEEVMDFSRHRSVQVLMLYRDRERNVQGQLAALVAQKAAAGEAAGESSDGNGDATTSAAPSAPSETR